MEEDTSHKDQIDQESDSEDIIFGTEVDLHHFSAKDIDFVLDEFFKQAAESGYKELRIVHGRGKSFKKKKVHTYLDSRSDILEYSNDGANWGATIVRVKK